MKKDGLEELRAAARRFVDQHILEITKAVLTFQGRPVGTPVGPNDERKSVDGMLREARERRIAEIRVKVAELEAELRQHIEIAASGGGRGRKVPPPVEPK